jgi:DNA sulfur modification protein DndC
LYEIRRLWQIEQSDWEDSVSKIFKEVTGESLVIAKDDLGSFSQTESDLLRKICTEFNIPVGLVTKLLDIEHQMQGMSRRASVINRLDEVLKEEWRSEEEVRKEMLKDKPEKIPLNPEANE